MAFKNPFTAEEMEEAEAVEVTPEMLDRVLLMGTAALSHFADTVMLPVFEGQLNPTDRELAFSGSFYRFVAVLRTLRDLRERYHFQVVAAATRTVLELSMDVEMLTKNHVPDPVEKFHAFTRAARFSAAYKLVKFFDENPKLEEPEDAAEHRALVSKPGEKDAVEALCQKHWQTLKAPQHWSGLDWTRQADLVKPVLRKAYMRWRSLLAWHIHGGAAGVGGLSPESFGALVCVCRYLTRDVVPPALRELGTAMHLHHAIPDFFDQLEFAEIKVSTLHMIDLQRQSLGYPPKFGGGES